MFYLPSIQILQVRHRAQVTLLGEVFYLQEFSFVAADEWESSLNPELEWLLKRLVGGKRKCYHSLLEFTCNENHCQFVNSHKILAAKILFVSFNSGSRLVLSALPSLCFWKEVLDTESSHFFSKSVQVGSWFQEDLKPSNLYAVCIFQPLLIGETRHFTKKKVGPQESNCMGADDALSRSSFHTGCETYWNQWEDSCWLPSALHQAAWRSWMHFSLCGKLLVGMNEYCQQSRVGLRTCQRLTIPTSSDFNCRYVMCLDGVSEFCVGALKAKCVNQLYLLWSVKQFQQGSLFS